MAFEYPPGIALLVHRLPRLLLPPASVYILLHTLGAASIISIPLWLQIILCLLSLPATFTISVIYKDYVDKKDAHAMGAVLPPMVKTRWIGGLDTLFKIAQNFKTGYIGLKALCVSIGGVR